MQALTRQQRRARKRMAKRRKKYRLERRALIKEMGGRCSECGYRWRLEFNHLVRRKWKAHKVGRWTRIKLYREEWERGEIDLRCSGCNKKAGQPKEDAGQ